MAASELSNSWPESKSKDDVLLPQSTRSTIVSVEIEGDTCIIIREEKPLPLQNKRIHKVPRELRENEQNKGLFDPRVVSIGPYHHGKPELQEVEKLKIRAAFEFMDDSKQEHEVFYSKILEVVSKARSCYPEGSTETYDDKAFARMMFLDGCFLLYFVEKYAGEGAFVMEELIGDLGFGRISVLLVDFILLENQLPFLEGKGEGLIETFIDKVFAHNLDTSTKEIPGRHQNCTRYQGDQVQQPLHFLELVRRRFLSCKIGEDGPGKQDQIFRRFFKLPSWSRSGGHKETKPRHGYYSFRSATELKARGIHFSPSATSYLNDFCFTPRCLYGQLKLPQVTVGAQTKRLFLNMMAYELAPSTIVGWELCSYINFMNSLINGADDVVELRSHNIIHNFLGNDEEVAKVFNSLAAFSVITPLDGIIKDVNDQIQEHYNSKRKTWTAQLLHNYFSTPWAALAFFAATFALVLTFIQTFFPR